MCFIQNIQAKTKLFAHSARNGIRYTTVNPLTLSFSISATASPSNTKHNHSQITRCCISSSLGTSSGNQVGRGGKDQAGGKKMSFVVGPWGGNGGTYWDDGTYNGIREISLGYDRCIDSIRVVYDKNGKPVAADKHGGDGGMKTEIKLQYPKEFLTSVSGHYCPVVYGGSPVIRSLTLKSNRRKYGPYGVEEGTPFSFSTDGGLIVGFKGRSGWYLDSLGFHLSHVQTTNLYQKVQQKLKKLVSIAYPNAPQTKGSAEA